MRPPASLNTSFVAGCILLGLVGMFTASFFQNRILTVKETRARGVVSANPKETGTALLPDGTGIPAPGAPGAELSERQTGDLTELMRKLQSAPNDADTLRLIGEIFLSAREWGRAEFFFGRAVLGRPGDVRPLYLLGVSQYQQNKIMEAAKTFEDLLGIREEPGAMFNLAIIYKYHSGKKTEAETLLRRIIAFPEAAAGVVARAKEELAKEPLSLIGHSRDRPSIFRGFS